MKTQFHSGTGDNHSLSYASGVPRRRFIKGLVAGAGLLAVGDTLAAAEAPPLVSPSRLSDFRGPNVVVIRFGGGARRMETIDPQATYSPFLCRPFAQHGTLFNKLE